MSYSADSHGSISAAARAVARDRHYDEDDFMSLRTLENEMRRDQHNMVLKESAKWCGVATLATLGVSFMAQKYSPFYRRMRIPFKIFVGLMPPTATFFTVADRAAMHADRAIAAKYSITHIEDKHRKPLSFTPEGIKDSIFEHRMSLVGFGWLATVAGVLTYNYNRTGLTRAQKGFNARLFSQLFALAGVGLIGLLTTNMGDEEKQEEANPYFEEVVHRDDNKNMSATMTAAQAADNRNHGLHQHKSADEAKSQSKSEHHDAKSGGREQHTSNSNSSSKSSSSNSNDHSQPQQFKTVHDYKSGNTTVDKSTMVKRHPMPTKDSGHLTTADHMPKASAQSAV